MRLSKWVVVAGASLLLAGCLSNYNKITNGAVPWFGPATTQITGHVYVGATTAGAMIPLQGTKVQVFEINAKDGQTLATESGHAFTDPYGAFTINLTSPVQRPMVVRTLEPGNVNGVSTGVTAATYTDTDAGITVDLTANHMQGVSYNVQTNANVFYSGLTAAVPPGSADGSGHVTVYLTPLTTLASRYAYGRLQASPKELYPTVEVGQGNYNASVWAFGAAAVKSATNAAGMQIPFANPATDAGYNNWMVNFTNWAKGFALTPVTDPFAGMNPSMHIMAATTCLAIDAEDGTMDGAKWGWTMTTGTWSHPVVSSPVQLQLLDAVGTTVATYTAPNPGAAPVLTALGTMAGFTAPQPGGAIQLLGWYEQGTGERYFVDIERAEKQQKSVDATTGASGGGYDD